MKDLKNFSKQHLKEQLSYIKDNYVDVINKESKYKKFKGDLFDTIKTNFIKYNGDTTDLLIKLVKQIYMNVKLYGVPCTMLMTPAKLTFKNLKLGISKSQKSTESRLRVLQKEGVIKRLDMPNKYGSFYILLVDINEPFVRPNKRHITADKIAVDNLPLEIQPIKKEEEEALQIMENEDIEKAKELKRKEWLALIEADEKAKQEKQLQSAEQRIDAILNEEEQEEDKPIINAQSLQERISQLEDAEEPLNDFKTIGDIINKYEQQHEEPDFMQSALKELETMKIGEEYSMDDFKEIFKAFCEPRMSSRGVKIPRKEQRGISMLVNILKEVEKEGRDPYRVLNYAYNQLWQGIQKSYLPSIYKELDAEDNYKKTGSHEKKTYNNNPYYGLMISGVATQAMQDERLLRELRELQQENPNVSIEDLINKTSTGIIQQTKKLIKEGVDNKFKEAQDKKERDIIDKSLQVYNLCLKYKKDEPSTKALWFNILDDNRGKAGYNSLIDYYVSKIGQKYPNDKERQNSFIQYSVSAQRMAKDNKITYIPVLFVYWLLEKKIKEDEKKCFDVIDYGFFDKMIYPNKYQKAFDEFLGDYACPCLIFDEAYVPASGFASGYFKKVLKPTNGKMCFLNDSCMTYDGVKLDELVYKFNNSAYSLLIKNNIVHNKFSNEDVFDFIQNSYFTVEGKKPVLHSRYSKDNLRNIISFLTSTLNKAYNGTITEIVIAPDTKVPTISSVEKQDDSQDIAIFER